MSIEDSTFFEHCTFFCNRESIRPLFGIPYMNTSTDPEKVRRFFFHFYFQNNCSLSWKYFHSSHYLCYGCKSSARSDFFLWKKLFGKQIAYWSFNDPFIIVNQICSREKKFLLHSIMLCMYVPSTDKDVCLQVLFIMSI